MLKQSLQQKLLQKASPLQIQTVKLLELPLIQLEDKIKKELEENPALEEEVNNKEQPIETVENTDSGELSLSDYLDDDPPNYRVSVNNNPREEHREYSVVSNSTSLHQMLEEQLAFHDLDTRSHAIGLFLIGSIDNNGYLRRNLQSIADDIAFKIGIESSIKEVDKILRIIQTFDPLGVGARNLRECLLIQLRNKAQTKDVKNAETVLRDYFEEFSKKHYSKIMVKFDISEYSLKRAMQEIMKLNPKPGAEYENVYIEQSQHIIPDFILELKDGKYELSLNSHNIPELRLNKDYSEIVKDYLSRKKLSQEERDTMNFVKQKIESAKWFIDSIKQRHETLLNVMSAIIDFQAKYFQTRNESDLRPMILKDIAEITGLDISTVSRVVNSKYVQCDWGILSLKFFFSESFSSDMGEVSTREMKNVIMECIEKENKKKPLKDDEIKEILKTKGFSIARRTIAKYREKMNVPVARLRREI
ncbi:MAG: RNA polymerase factor sigma-54 [Prevotellaceae bacterium]|jgi:RNA polymerase sigma-54 factor|nr:RNA polymerase factor sigma-54 [Prevotellaceae bacterium]